MTLSSYRILIVDDNPTFVKTLSFLIQNVLGEKLTVLDISTNGKEAVERANQNFRYNIIFMDVNMPEMDGITATKIINQNHYRETKIVAVSFNKDFKTLNQMIESGAVNYLYKDNLTVDVLEKVFDFQSL